MSLVIAVSITRNCGDRMVFKAHSRQIANEYPHACKRLISGQMVGGKQPVRVRLALFGRRGWNCPQLLLSIQEAFFACSFLLCLCLLSHTLHPPRRSELWFAFRSHFCTPACRLAKFELRTLQTQSQKHSRSTAHEERYAWPIYWRILCQKHQALYFTTREQGSSCKKGPSPETGEAFSFSDASSFASQTKNIWTKGQITSAWRSIIDVESKREISSLQVKSAFRTGTCMGDKVAVLKGSQGIWFLVSLALSLLALSPLLMHFSSTQRQVLSLITISSSCVLSVALNANGIKTHLLNLSVCLIWPKKGVFPFLAKRFTAHAKLSDYWNVREVPV